MERLKRRIEGMKGNLAVYNNEKEKLEKELKKLGVKKLDEKSINGIMEKVSKELKSLKNEHSDLEESVEESLERFEDDDV